MGKLFEYYCRKFKSKRCILCGIILDDGYHGDICECCLDDMRDKDELE